MSERMESFPEGEKSDVLPLTTRERILAQRDIIGLYEGMTEEEKIRIVEENSGPFRELEQDAEVRQLIRKGNIEEVARRLEKLKQEKQEKAA
jgi:hypothetical protein